MALEADESLLLDLLNTAAPEGGVPRDELADADAGGRWLAAHGQPATVDEWRALVDARAALQRVIRGCAGAGEALASFVDGVGIRASLAEGGLAWLPELPEGRTAAARAVLAWDVLRVSSPGRLRPCANPDCRRFLIDHSKPNSARWCSMAVCGNRMKARRHYRRTHLAG